VFRKKAPDLTASADRGEYCEAVRGKRLPAARCAVTRRRVPSAETLEGRQCQFPLYEASEIPLLLHRVLQPFLLAGASHARPTKRLEAQQICFSARRSWASDQRFANAGPAFCLMCGKRLPATPLNKRKAVPAFRDRKLLRCLHTINAPALYLVPGQATAGRALLWALDNNPVEVAEFYLL
jgi:hypothetical protein